MAKKKVYLTIFFILILAFFAANFSYPQLLNLPYLPEIPFKLGLDLQGGTHLVYEADLANIEKGDYKSSMQGLRDRIERRVSSKRYAGVLGVEEPVIQIQETGGRYRLIVELAGVKDPAEAVSFIGEAPFLEFKEQKPEKEVQKIQEKQKELEGKTEEEITKIENWEKAFEDPFQSTSLTGRYLKEAKLGFDQTTVYEPLVLLQFDDEGAKIFEELTEKNIGKPLAIYIDGEPITAPIVQGRISGGDAQITGDFTLDYAKSLVANLNDGALPVPISLVSQQTVGPTLGAISLEKSLKAALLGFLAIIIFMIVFYKMPGILAALSLIIYVSLVLTVFKLVPVTLTLAGIGGFILSMGMAVDANVLIFSRMREELKQGKNLGQAIEEGFNRAWSSIRDGNVTTLIVAAVLFGFGTSFIKGFALTLSLGILISMFSAIVISKNFLRFFVWTKLEKVKWLW